MYWMLNEILIKTIVLNLYNGHHVTKLGWSILDIKHQESFPHNLSVVAEVDSCGPLAPYTLSFFGAFVRFLSFLAAVSFCIFATIKTFSCSCVECNKLYPCSETILLVVVSIGFSQHYKLGLLWSDFMQLILITSTNRCRLEVNFRVKLLYNMKHQFKKKINKQNFGSQV